MALDNYSPCPCGSGKKFKWCCQPIYTVIEKAFAQEADGQHEAALRTMDELVAQQPVNPEAWGRRAQLLYQNGRVEDAESSLQKALEINDRYPFGHFLRGKFREHEGEIAGALLQFRKAAEFYDPEAKDVLADLFMTITDCELKMNRPVAARAALRLAIHFHPSQEELRQSFEALFGQNSHLPEVARKEYAYAQLAPGAAESRRSDWDQALSNASTGKLSDAANAFAELTAKDETNSTAWYNLGLTRAWLGDNRAALAALDRYIALEGDETKAGAAAALGEVLRCGMGMNDEANYLEHSALYQVRDPRAVGEVLSAWDRDRRLLVTQTSEKQGILMALVLDAGAGIAGASAPARGIGAYLLIIVDQIRISNVNADALLKIQQELEQRGGAGLTPARRDERPANFNEILSEALVFPADAADQEAAKRKVAEQVQKFFEDVWVHRPLRSLGMSPPIDAVGHKDLRKKLIGAVQFVQDCAQPRETYHYDFDRLRRRLGLVAAEPLGTEKRDIGALSAAELASFKPDTLADDELETAYQSAVKLDARELASQFARALIERPTKTGGVDKFPWFTFLTNQALAEANTQEALDLVNAGEKHDCEHNEGRRRNEYELRRGQIHAKRGETDDAIDVFERLIARVPSELKYRATAAEALLSARQPAKAAKIAEDGLAEARKQNNRDSEAHFMELVSAAKR